jgi:hypothetical protein
MHGICSSLYTSWLAREKEPKVSKTSMGPNSKHLGLDNGYPILISGRGRSTLMSLHLPAHCPYIDIDSHIKSQTKAELSLELEIHVVARFFPKK